MPADIKITPSHCHAILPSFYKLKILNAMNVDLDLIITLNMSLIKFKLKYCY